MSRLLLGCAALAAALFGSAPQAAAQNLDSMAKWTNARVIRYHAVGDYTGEVGILEGERQGLLGLITDHIELDIDWDNVQQKMIGQPVIRNFPTRLTKFVQAAGCPTPKVEGTFEYWTVQSITAASTILTLQGKRNSPAGAIPYANEEPGSSCGQYWEKAAAKSEAVTADLQLPGAMVLALPEAAGEMEITKDGKSIIVREDTDGWVWTVTPTIAR